VARRARWRGATIAAGDFLPPDMQGVAQPVQKLAQSSSGHGPKFRAIFISLNGPCRASVAVGTRLYGYWTAEAS
jgi:hypothetical protein